MAHFAKIKCSDNLGAVYVNVDQITEFFFVSRANKTIVILQNKERREYPGDQTDRILLGGARRNEYHGKDA